MAQSHIARARKGRQAQFRRMVLSHYDFEDARAFLNKLEPMDSVEDVVHDPDIRRALMTAMLVSYWRPFSGNEPDGETATVLPSSCLRGLTEAQQLLHCRIGELRNREFAHSDPKPAELKVDWSPTDPGFAFPVPVLSIIRQDFNSVELRLFGDLLAHVSRRVFEQYVALGEELHGQLAPSNALL